MKLAYVLGEFPSVSETFILRELAELRRRGFQVLILALKPPSDTVVHDPAITFLEQTRYRPVAGSREWLGGLAWAVGRHPLRLLRIAGWTLGGAWRHPREALRRLKNLPAAAAFARQAARFGVVHVHAHFASLPADVAYAVAALLGLRFSLSVHAADILLPPRRLLARRVGAACFVAACTQFGAAALARRLGAAVPRLHVIRHGVAPVAAGGMPESGVPVIVATGRLVPKKGFAVLVDACRRLRERGCRFRCVILGDGPLRGALAASVAAGGLQETVTLAGAVSQADVDAWLKRARLFALPCVVAPDGDCDGLPNAILEAMAAGVPVVSTPVGAINEAVESGRTGLLVAPGDAGALAAAMEELLKNDGLCRTLGLSGRAMVTERFDVARNVEPLAALFEQAQRTE